MRHHARVRATWLTALALAASWAAVPDAEAQQSRSLLSQFSHRHWNRQDGLPQDSVRAIAQAADGALWVGTDEGLARFDGTEFTRYRKGDAGLPNSSVTALAASRDGSMWVGTLAGLSHFDGRRFINFDAASGLQSPGVSGLIESRDGTIWAVNGLVVTSIRDGRLTTYGTSEGVPPEGLRKIAEGRDGGIYAAGIGVVLKFANARFERFADAATMRGNIAQAMAVDEAGAIWVGGTLGLVAIDGGNVRTYGVAQGLPEPLVRATRADRAGRVWLSTVNGLAVLDRGGLTPVYVDGMSAMVWDIFEDRDGALWVGTNAGLHQFRRQPLTVFGTPEGFPSDQPNALHQTQNGDIWIGFRDAGALRIANGRQTRYTQRDGLAANEVFDIRSGSDDSILMATRLGLTTLTGTRLTTTIPVDPLGRHMVYSVLDDGDGRRLLGTGRGVLRLDGSTQTEIIPGGPTLNSAIVAMARGSDGTLWAGTYGEGLWRHANGVAAKLTVRDGLSSDAIRTLHYDASAETLWIGTTGGGLAWYRANRFSHVGTAEGLESDNVGQVIDDGRGALWLGTSTGVARIEKADLLGGVDLRTKPHLFLESSGLRSSHAAANFPAAGGGMRDRDGRLWFATADGVAVLSSDPVPAIPPAPVRVEQILVDGLTMSIDDGLEIPPSARQLEFRYGAVSLVAADRLRYRYRLEGLDTAWRDGGARRSAAFGRLPPGRYRFVVEASMLGETASAHSASFEFRRLASWQEAAWLPYAAVLALVALGLLVQRARVRRTRTRFEALIAERNRLSRELHDTLSQHFVGIVSQLRGVSTALPRTPEAAERHLDVARRMAQHGLTETRRAIMDLRSPLLEAGDLAGAIRSVASEMIAGTPTTFAIAGSPGELSADVQQQLLRIAQEAITNARKHAKAGTISVDIVRSSEQIALTIADDGVGFDGAFDGDGTHFGLQGMRERVARLGGILTVERGNQRGTVVRARVPIS